MAFKMKSGNKVSFKNMGSSSPAKDTGHGAEEGHGHLEKSGKVDTRTLSNRYSEFNKKQIEKGHPQKIVTIRDGKRGWSWEGKENEFHPMPSTEGERSADIKEYTDKEKIGGKGVVTANKSDVTRKAITKEANVDTNEKSKKQLLKEAGKSTSVFNRLFTSKEALKKKARTKNIREMKNMLVSQVASNEEADAYNESEAFTE